MTALITTKNVLDAQGNSVPLQVIDQSGNGSGPFQFVHIAQTEGWKPTYSATVFNHTPAASPTDIFTLVPGAKRVRILRIVVSGFATTAGQFVLGLVRRSSADTAGTSSTITAVAHEQADSAATMTVTKYTANPTLGATPVTQRSGRLLLNVATAQPDRLQWDFTRDNGKALVLANSTDILTVNGNAATLPTGAQFDFEVTWTEDPV